MLEFLRKHTVVVMAAVALVFVGLVFLNDGKSGGLPWQSAPAAFKIADTTYTYKDVSEYGRYFTMARQVASTANELLEGHRAVENNSSDDWRYSLMINSVLLRLEADRYGIYPGKEEIDATIASLPELQTTDGRFNQEAYDTVVLSLGKSLRQQAEAALRDVVGDLIRQRKLMQIVAGGIEPNDAFAKAFFESSAQLMEVNTAVLAEGNYRPTEEPTEEAVKNFWDKYKQNFKSREARDVTLYQFKPRAEIVKLPDSRLPAATLEVLDQVESVWEKIIDVNAKGMEDMINEAANAESALYTLEKKTYPAVTIDKIPAELNVKPHESIAGVNARPIAYDALKLVTEDRKRMIPGPDGTMVPAPVTADHLMEPFVLGDDTVVLLVVSNIIPETTLEYNEARPAARAALLDEMTEQNMMKAAAELREKLLSDGRTSAQFKAIAEAANATVRHWDELNVSVVIPDLIGGSDIFESLREVNPGGISRIIPVPGDGAVLAQLVKRTIVDSPLTGIREAESVTLSKRLTQMALLVDWYKNCASKYNLEISIQSNRNPE